MFDFLNMAYNYEDRKVANTIVGKTEIDTCAVTDSDQPYETGICSPLYNEGAWVIVEMYDSKEQAQKGHDKWVKIMNNPPKELKDVSTCSVKKLLNELMN